MNFRELKKLEGHHVSIWPRPRVLPEGRRARMTWLVERVDGKERAVKLLAPSGHFFNAADVIHHFQREGRWLILDAQVVIRGHEIELLPQPWGEAMRSFRRRRRARRARAASLWPSASEQQIPQQMVAARLQLLNA